MKKTRLFTPGPTPLFPEVQLALARPIIHHRTPEFRELLGTTRERLQAILKTGNEVLILACSGTGAMEASVRNILTEGDRALAVVAGKFGERWAEICESAAIPCSRLDKKAGEAATAGEILEAIDREPGISAVLLQGCETSTATSHDLRVISHELHSRHPDVFLIVDAITALGTQPVETDAWGLDVVISGSQKSFGLPPGLAFLSVSSRCAGRINSNPSRPYYFDLMKELDGQKKGQTAYTPAVSLVVALNEAARIILSQGVDAIVAEAQMMARATRRGLQAIGFRILSQAPSGAATAAYPPEGISGADLAKTMERNFGVKVAGGQGDLKGKIIRIAHLGYYDLLDVFSVLSALELSLKKLGAPVRLGSGLAAALEEADASGNRRS